MHNLYHPVFPLPAIIGGGASLSRQLFYFCFCNPLTAINRLCYGWSMLKHALPERPRGVVACGTSLPSQLDEAQADRIAVHLKALADPMRLRILDLLAQQTGPLCVCDITAAFDVGQPTISHHLRVLRQAGFIESKKEGIWVYYWLTAAGSSSIRFAQTVG